jgi:hypothetical protein
MSHRDEPVNGCAAIYQIDHGCSDGVCGEPCEFKPAALATDRPAVNVGASRPYPQFARRRGIRGEFDLGTEVSRQARPAAVKATTGGPARKSGRIYWSERLDAEVRLPSERDASRGKVGDVC